MHQLDRQTTDVVDKPSTVRRVWDRLGVVFYNFFITHVPFYAIRHGVLRLWGAEIGEGSAVFRNTTVLGIDKLRIGRNTGIGFRCMLDARGGLTIGDQVVIASDVHFITGSHIADSDTFDYTLDPIVVADFAWIASRSTVLQNLTIGRGAVVGASSLVREDIPEMAIAAGVPTRVLGRRESALEYNPSYRPPFF